MGGKEVSCRLGTDKAVVSVIHQTSRDWASIPKLSIEKQLWMGGIPSRSFIQRWLWRSRNQQATGGKWERERAKVLWYTSDIKNDKRQKDRHLILVAMLGVGGFGM